MNGKVVLAVVTVVVLSFTFVPVGVAIPWYELFRVVLSHRNPTLSPWANAVPTDAVPGLQPRSYVGGGGRAFTR